MMVLPRGSQNFQKYVRLNLTGEVVEVENSDSNDVSIRYGGLILTFSWHEVKPVKLFIRCFVRHANFRRLDDVMPLLGRHSLPGVFSESITSSITMRNKLIDLEHQLPLDPFSPYFPTAMVWREAKKPKIRLKAN